jgi:hypothetical protein
MRPSFPRRFSSFLKLLRHPLWHRAAPRQGVAGPDLARCLNESSRLVAPVDLGSRYFEEVGRVLPI